MYYSTLRQSESKHTYAFETRHLEGTPRLKDTFLNVEVQRLLSLLPHRSVNPNGPRRRSAEERLPVISAVIHPFSPSRARVRVEIHTISRSNGIVEG